MSARTRVSGAAVIVAAVVALILARGNSSLPSGVTLTAPDGGANYFSQWSGTAAWTDSFFPISAFGQFDLGAVQSNGMTRGAGHADAGINVELNPANGVNGSTDGGTDGSVAKANGMYVVGNPSQANVTGSALGSVADHVTGWLYGDELDGHTCASESGAGGTFDKYSWLLTAGSLTCADDPGHGTISPTFLKNFSDELRSQDTTRPVFMGYTHPWAWRNGCASPCDDFALAGDVLGYDVYTLVDQRFTNIIPTLGHPYAAYDSIMLTRSLNGTAKPIWPDLEVSATDTGFNNSPIVEPTDAQIQALAWNAIIGGARGITWFNICICSGLGYVDFDVINNADRFPTRHAAIKTLDAKIQSLAAVINSDFAVGYLTARTGTVNAMVKWVPARHAFYLFAASGQTGAQTVKFTIAGSPTTVASVVGENRAITLEDGKFSDFFADEDAVHIYEIPNA